MRASLSRDPADAFEDPVTVGQHLINSFARITLLLARVQGGYVTAVAAQNRYSAAIAAQAGTASEVALASAIYVELVGKGLNSEFIERTIRTANGLDGLYSLYLSFGNALPVKQNKVRANLAGIRNEAAHAGRIPSHEEAARAVEVAHALVTAALPIDA